MSHRNSVAHINWFPCLVVLAVSSLAGSASAQWSQWGGPDRDFTVKAAGLAEQWPADGPKKLWNRSLGDGYSTIVADGGLLYTMYRSGADEFVIAVDAKTGETVWEHKNNAPITDDRASYGPGPYATPLIHGDLVYTVGTNSVFHAFDKKTGDVVFMHDLVNEYGAAVQGFGYSSSPIVYKGTLILPVARRIDGAAKGDDGKDKTRAQSLMGFDLRTGKIAWDNKNYEVTENTSTYSSPILINVSGQDQLVLFMTTELAGLDPSNGNRLWGVPHNTQYDENVSTPVFDGKDTLFCSSAYGTGSRGVRLSSADGKTHAKELWYTKKMRVLHGNVVEINGYAYGSSGDFGPTFFGAVDIATGKLAWRKRGFKKANCLGVGDKLIILDEDGQLALATASPGDLTIHTKCNLDLNGAWATPTLVGKTLFIRDRKQIMALDLGKG